MDIDHDAREWAHWDLVDAPPGGLEVSFNGGDWVALIRDGDTVRVLVAGPDAADNPPGTTVMTRTWNRATIRATSDPEIVVRDAGSIRVWR